MLDIGSYFIKGAVAKVYNDNSFEILSISKEKSQGFIKDGLIINIESIKNCIQSLVDRFEQDSGYEINSFVVGIGGSNVTSFNINSSIVINNEQGITEYDLNKAKETALSQISNSDITALHCIPKSFILNGTDVVQNPLHFIAKTLESQFHIITIQKKQQQRIETCLRLSNCKLNKMIFNSLSSIETFPTMDEKNYGAILIDIGYENINFVIVKDNLPILTHSLSYGANVLTSDIAYTLEIPVDISEKLKIENGCCWKDNIKDDDCKIQISNDKSISKSELYHILNDRMIEIFTKIKHIINKSNYEISKGNVYLTGGGSLLNGVEELAKSVFNNENVKIATLKEITGLDEKYKTPEYASVIGLLLCNFEYSNI